ncbi:MAG: hypothetical protein LBH40_05880 [Alphaproteobacteria bacterium]|jgi:hypothetical protein|nr:hypothetical protein [Alphaproteobacteria bacterium]
MPRIIDLISKSPSKEDYILIGNGALTLNEVIKLLHPHPEFQIVHLAKEEKVIRNDPFVYILLDGTDYRNTEYAKIHNYFKEVVSVKLPNDFDNIPRVAGRIFVYKTDGSYPAEDGGSDVLGARIGKQYEGFWQFYFTESENPDETVNVVRLKSGTYTLPTAEGLDLTDAVGKLIKVNTKGTIVALNNYDDDPLSKLNPDSMYTGIVQQVNSDGTLEVLFEFIETAPLNYLARFGEPTFQPGDIPNLTDQPYMLKLNNDVVGVKNKATYKVHKHSIHCDYYNDRVSIMEAPLFYSDISKLIYSFGDNEENLKTVLITEDYIPLPINVSEAEIIDGEIDRITPSSKIINFYCKMKLD